MLSKKQKHKEQITFLVAIVLILFCSLSNFCFNMTPGSPDKSYVQARIVLMIPTVLLEVMAVPCVCVCACGVTGKGELPLVMELVFLLFRYKVQCPIAYHWAQ